MKKAIILGAGQLGRLIAELLKRCGEFECLGFLDSAPSMQDQKVVGIPVLGGDDYLEKLRGQVDAVFIAIADSSRRKAMLYTARELGFSVPNIIDPSANLASDVRLGEGVLVSMGATVLNATAIGDGVIVGTGVTILHDVEIGAFCTIGGGALVGAGTKIGDQAFIGVGAVIASGGYNIGDHAKLAAGAVALKDLPKNAMAIGNPARVIKNNDEPMS